MNNTFANKRHSPSALIIGGANLDVVATARGDASAGESVPGAVVQSCGGVGRNIAANLAQLKISSQLLTAVGNDRDGQRLIDETRNCGVDVSSVVRVAEAATASYVSINNGCGEMVCAVSDMQVIENLQLEDFPQLSDQLVAAEVCVIDANLCPEFIHAVVATESAARTQLVADAVSVVKCRRLQPVLKHLTLLKANRREAVALAGADEATEVDTLADALLKTGLQRVVISQGAGDVLYADHACRYCCRTDAGPVINVSGAGDALMAAVVAAGLYRQPVREWLGWGIAAAALTCQSDHAVASELTLARVAGDLL